MHLYVHIPFCHHICPYCGFYKHQPGKLANREFVEAILLEAKARTDSAGNRIETVFFGGGTPSLLSPTHLELLCVGLKKSLPLSEVTEWTLEANPATFDLEKAELMRSLGVDRISLGVQSFQPETLKTLGRDHSRDDAIEAYETLREAGFENVSIDLMFSIPGQTRELWSADLEQAIELCPDHISAYNLTYEEDTEFLARHESGDLDTDEDRDADLFADAISRLEAAGFVHYEISNYARPGFESLHNQAYWTGEDYLGLGPSAVSTLQGTRSTSIADTAAYVKAAKAGFDTRTEIEILSAEDLRIERIALQLRTREGVPVALLPRGEESQSNPVDTLIQQGLICLEGDRVVLTQKGKALADPISAALV
ncbi:MAG: radical SAM family heme chaperone HemW [Verrucomicrobiales bacterium]|nr:radical SAM family heme chaperone HemW [Verrucomicrobiales bacterium]